MPADNKVKFSGHLFDCLDGGFAPDEPVDVVVRPEDFEVVSPEQGQLVGTVKSVLFMGVHYEIMVETEHFTWTVHSINHADVGDRVGLFLTPDDIHIMHKS